MFPGLPLKRRQGALFFMWVMVINANFNFCVSFLLMQKELTAEKWVIVLSPALVDVAYSWKVWLFVKINCNFQWSSLAAWGSYSMIIITINALIIIAKTNRAISYMPSTVSRLLTYTICKVIQLMLTELTFKPKSFWL